MVGQVGMNSRQRAFFDPDLVRPDHMNLQELQTVTQLVQKHDNYNVHKWLNFSELAVTVTHSVHYRLWVGPIANCRNWHNLSIIHNNMNVSS